MAVHLWFGRILSVSLLVLFGLAGTARADHVLTHPTATQQAVGVAAAARDAKGLFEKWKETKIRRDASIYITPGNIPKNDRFLKTYDADNAARNGANAAPGLLGIADQTYHIQGGASVAENKTYSLADAMHDAVWRKNTAAKLMILMSQRRLLCANDAENSAASTPSIGLRTTC